MFIFIFDSYSGICNSDLYHTIRRLSKKVFVFRKFDLLFFFNQLALNLNISAFSREFERVRLQIKQNLLDSLHIATDHAIIEALKYVIEFNTNKFSLKLLN